MGHFACFGAMLGRFGSKSKGLRPFWLRAGWFWDALSSNLGGIDATLRPSWGVSGPSWSRVGGSSEVSGTMLVNVSHHVGMM